MPSGMKVALLYCGSMAFMALCYLGSNKMEYGALPTGVMANIMGVLSMIAFSVSGYWIYHRNRNGALVLIGWTALSSIQGSLMMLAMFNDPVGVMGSSMENSPFYSDNFSIELFSAMSGPMMLIMILSGLTYLAVMIWYFWKHREYFTNE